MKISKSSLMSFITCPQKYFLGYEVKLKPIRTSSDLLVGRSTHHLISSHFAGNMQNETCDLDRVLEEFWSPFNLENTDFMNEWELESSKRESLQFARLFMRETTLEPSEVEYRFALPVIDLESGEVLEDVDLVGIIDLIDRPDGAMRAVEIKTKTRKPDDFAARTSIELTCYAYWLRFLEDHASEGIQVSYVNIIKNKKPYIHWQHQERRIEDFIDLFHVVRTVTRNIMDQRFYPNPGIHCSWCDYRVLCARDAEGVKEKFGSKALEDLRERNLVRI
jgi:CRISPR/Cas system-associated exonuclease Cas4 (RecB family)